MATRCRKFVFGVVLWMTLVVALAGKSPGKTFPARGIERILSKEQAAERLERFRDFHAIDPAEDAFHHGFALRFRLEHYPRRGERVIREGTTYGLAFGHSWLRLDLAGEEGNRTECYLFRNGPEPKAWRGGTGVKVPQPLGRKDLFAPIVAGMNHTPFDLLMPFVYWRDWRYGGSGRVVGRPAHLYEFGPPAWAVEAAPDLRRVRLALDDAYETPLQVKMFGRRGIAEKTIGLVSLKKVGEHWIAKILDCRHAQTRSKTRFRVTAAAVDLDLGREVFEPTGLSVSPRVCEEHFLSTE